ncbi:MAG: ubiquitin-like domain-containing protein [Candidatus Saccharibacteria bacterium]
MKKRFSNPSKTPHQARIHRLKNHPFVVPVATFLVLFIFTMLGFIFLGGSTVGPSDSHIVHLYIDGKQQILPSRASTVGDLLNRAQVQVGEHDVVEPSRDAEITDDNFSINVYRAHAVTIVDTSDAGKKTSLATYTAQQSPTSIVKQAGIQLLPEDTAVLAPSDNVLRDGIISQKVVVDRATPVKLNLYGVTYDVRTHANTVEELMKERSIKYDAASVSPALATPIKTNDAIFVTNPGKKIATTEEIIVAGQITVNDPNLALGQTKVQSEGVDGKRVVVYEVAADGTQKALQTVIVIEPVAKVIAKGSKVVANRIGGDKGSILTAAGVPAGQQAAADFVISRESGWNLAAHNSGGCLGLGQACPGSKLVNACPNWDTDATCQVRFFSGYSSRYGGWQGAQEFWLLHGWW